VLRTGVFIDPECLLHDPGPGHPESPQRLQTLLQLLRRQDIRHLPHTMFQGRLATLLEVQRVHTPAYVHRVQQTEGLRVRLDNDTITSARSYDAALRAAGGALAATEAVMAGQVDNAIVLCRPPGHHAEPDRSMGFCIFNNVAIAARHAREVLGVRRIAIVDFDVHHGNGTQAAFLQDPSVLYISTHMFPHFPGTGAATEMGEGMGRGRTLNIPLGRNHGDAEYDAIYGSLVSRVLEGFRPELILVSAGFDILSGDPMGGMAVTYDGVLRIVGHLVNAAELLSKHRIVMVLEGGYTGEGLEQGVLASLEAMTQTIRVSDPGPLVHLPLGDAARYLDIYREFFTI
jgi:acetoin utilization deacetylase AcuC-like enzyme